MKQLKIEIPSGANEIIHTLQEKGYEAYLVGGCVRDSILKDQFMIMILQHLPHLMRRLKYSRTKESLKLVYSMEQ